MKASQFSDAQKAFVIKQGDEGVPVERYAGKPVSARLHTSIGARSMWGCCRRR
jgi:putative transposase